MAQINKPSSKEFVQGSFDAAPDDHNAAKGLLALALWRLWRK